MTTRTYQILDVGFEIQSTQDSFLDVFHQDYPRFAVPALETGQRLSIRFEPGGDGEGAYMEVDGRQVALEGHLSPDRMASLSIAQLLMDRVEAFTILHAAVVGTPDGALAISGPSGAGKTTLTLSLLEAGYSFLSDDFCPLHRESGLVHPFQRSLWVREQPGQESMNQRSGKVLFPLDGRSFPMETHPLPLKWLVCLDAGANSKEMGIGLVRMELREGLEGPLVEAIRSLEGTEILKVRRQWLVRYPRREGYTRRMKNLLQQHREACWHAYTLSDAEPDFSKEPTLVPFPTHEAAFFLLRELKHSLIGDERPGSIRPGALLSHIGALLSGVACYRLTPGPRARRLYLVQELLKPKELN